MLEVVSVNLTLKSPVLYKKSRIEFCHSIPSILCSWCHVNKASRVSFVSEDTPEGVGLFGHLVLSSVHTIGTL